MIQQAKWFSIRNLASEETAEISLWGEIGGGWFGEEGVSAKAFKDGLDSIPRGKKILLSIHSPGGSVWDGLAMHNLLAERAADITAKVLGLAASAASYVMLGASKVIAPKNARIMVHDAQGFAMGNSREMDSTSKLLEEESDNIAGMYAAKTGKPVAYWRDKMRATYWMTGQQAKDEGLVDEVNGEEPVKNTFNLSVFRCVPVDLGGLEPPPTGTHNNKVHMEPKQNTPEAGAPNAANTPEPKLDNAALIAAIGALTARMDNAAKAPVVIPHIDPAAPIGNSSSIQVIGDANDKFMAFNGPSRERRRFAIAAFSDIIASRRKADPKNNTISSTLTTAILDDTVVTILQNKLAPLQALFTDVMADPQKPMAVIQVPKVTVGPTVQTDPTDWESGDSTVTNASVTLHEYSASFHITNAELQSGSRIDWLTRIAASNFANKLLDVFAAILTTSNFTNAVVTSSAGAFSVDDLKSLWASAKNFTMKNLVIDGGHFARLMPTSTQSLSVSDGAPGYWFDGIWYSNRWSAAGSDVVGFVASPEAALVTTALPIEPPGASSAFSSISSATVPGLGITVQTSSWVKPGTRVQWQAFDVLMGVGVCDATALTLLKAA